MYRKLLTFTLLMCISLVGCTSDKSTVNKTTELQTQQEIITTNSDVDNYQESAEVASSNDITEKLAKRKEMSEQEIYKEIKEYWSNALDDGLKWKYKEGSYGFNEICKVFSVGKCKIEMYVSQNDSKRIASGFIRLGNPKKIDIDKIVIRNKTDSVSYNSVEAKICDWDKSKEIYWTPWAQDSSERQKEKYKKLKSIVESGENISIELKGAESYVIKGQKLTKYFNDFIRLSDELMTYYYDL